MEIKFIILIITSFKKRNFMAEEKSKKLRLFIGSCVEFPIVEKDNIAKLCEHFPCPIKFIEKPNIHLTWKFIGEIEAEKLDEVQNIIEEIIEKKFDILINFKKFEIWPSEKRPSLLVLIGKDLNGSATKLHQKLDKKLEKLKITREKRNFLPHITVARFKLKQRPVEKFIIPEWLLFDEINVKFSKLSIFQCTSTEKGSIYTPLKSFDI